MGTSCSDWYSVGTWDCLWFGSLALSSIYVFGSEACSSFDCRSGEDLTPWKSTFSLPCILSLGRARLRCHISPQIMMSNTTTAQHSAITLARKMLRGIPCEGKPTTLEPTIKHWKHSLVVVVVFFLSNFTLRNTKFLSTLKPKYFNKRSRL